MDEQGAITGYYDNQVDNYNQDHYQLHWNQRYNTNWSTTLSLNYTYGRGYFEEYVDDYYYSNILFAPDSGFDFLGLDPITVNGETVDSQDYVRRRWLDNDFYVLNANANYKNGDLDVIFGTSFSHYDGDHFGEVIWAEYASELPLGERYYEGNGKKNDFSAFGKASYQLNKRISLFADLQIRNVNYETSGQESTSLQPFDVDVNYTFFNPKAGITYELNTDNDLYFSYARANREPRRADFENNPEVRPEQLDDFELGWRHRKNGFSFNANTYFMFYRDQLVLTGALDDVGSPVRTNSGTSHRIGLEMEAVIPLGEHWALQPNLTLSTNRNQDFIASTDGDLVNLGTTEIAFSPSIVGANAVTYSPSDNLQLSFLSKYVGEQFMSNTEASLSRLDAYFVNDLNVVYTIQTNKIFDRIVLTGLVNNIFDQEFISNGYYYSGVGFEGAGFYPQATINFLAGISLFF
jgi:iron complex outermembrane receptor protein